MDALVASALITGVTGQDGYYLSQLLLSRGYRVVGMCRRSSTDNMWRVRALVEGLSADEAARFSTRFGDMTDGASLLQAVIASWPDEVYNLAAMSDVAVSFVMPEYCANVDGVGVLRLLEALRIYDDMRVARGQRRVRVYQASTSELFGSAPAPQCELTPFEPRSPYAIAKQYAYWIARNYREAYGMFICNGILFNHESPMRGENFLTRKITRAVADIVTGGACDVSVGNLDAVRDWGHAEDYVLAMHLMLRADTAADYVVASGHAIRVRDFIRLAFECVGIDIEWCGSGATETGVESGTGRILVRVDTSLFRPTEVDNLCGDATAARERLGWPGTRSICDIVREMVAADLHAAGKK